MITYHPAASRLPNGQGYRPLVMLRRGEGAKGRMAGAKTGYQVFTGPDAKAKARDAARLAAHNAVATLARDYPQFTAAVAAPRARVA